MADEQKQGEEGSPKEMSSDSGLGNLPPLSDFDSQSGLSGSDSGLPPLGSFDSATSDTPSDQGGLPPISDIDVETPQPTGGNIRSTPSGFQTSDGYSSGDSDLNTPASGTGFQDLAADSDFSPETPDIGPGPGTPTDSNLDTPMFDSAFGGGESGFDASVQTPAPTQAMETPMFGGDQAPAAAGGEGFDQGAFAPMETGDGAGGGGIDFDAGTPAPDFSPDTDIQQATPAGTPPAGKKAKKGGGSPLVLVAAVVVALLIGIVAGPYAVKSLPIPLPNPFASVIAEKEATIASQKAEIARLKKIEVESPGGVNISREEEERLQKSIEKLVGDVKTKSAELEKVAANLSEQEASLDVVERDIEAKNEEFMAAHEQFVDLQNETKIIQARQRGLVAEVDRLTNYVGELDVANRRRVATKDALEHNVDRLIVQVKEGMPLTPAKYAYRDRLAAVESLGDKVSAAKWVTPALQDAYTELYLKELEIASVQEYFFAKLPLTDDLGNKVTKWSECLMKGNWGVYYRSLDGKSIGVYQNMSNGATPIWSFKEDVTPRVQKEIEDEIVSFRGEDFESKIQVLAQKQLSAQEGTGFQRNFDSL